MRVGHRLAELLIEYGVEYVFGVPGGQTLPFYEGIRKTEGRLRHVLMRDERSAGFAADAYARLTGRAGVCDATVGPGATNLVSALAEAYCSSIPMLAVISDISRSWEHRRERGNASQAISQLDMFSTISKWRINLSEPNSVETVVDAAFRIAVTGKPGPVVISVPDDVGPAVLTSTAPGLTPGGASFPRFRTSPDPIQVARACDLLQKSRRTVLLVGGGVHISGAYEEVRELAERLGALVVTTISGKGVIDEDHPLACGVGGVFGNPAANEAQYKADLVFFIGCKAGQMATQGYNNPAQSTPTIHLDLDPEEIGRNYNDSLPLQADAKLGLAQLLKTLGDSGVPSAWEPEYYKEKNKAWYEDQADRNQLPGRPLRPQIVMEALNRIMTKDDLVVCDASLSSGWAAAYLRLKGAGRRFIAPRGLAGLGWGAPAAVGAALATNKRNRILHIAGDCGFSYSVAELETMARLNLPVLTIILNNDVLGWIKHVQKDYYRENYISTDFNHVDFNTVARGFGARGYTARTTEELDEFLIQEENPQGPAVIEVITDEWETPVLKFTDTAGA